MTGPCKNRLTIARRWIYLAVSLPSLGLAQTPPPVIERPAAVVWGSFRHNEQLVDAGASQWNFVQQNMDAYLLHGAYWNYATNSIGSPSPDMVGPKLAAILAGAGNKPVILEHLLAGEYPEIDSAFGNAFAGNLADSAGFGSAISNIKRLQSYGFPRPNISTDYIMTAWKEAVRWHPEWTSSEFFTALSGSWETYTGSQFNPAAGSTDRNRYGWFRQWVERLATAYPGIRVTATNSPVYFNWEENGVNRRELGGNFNNFFTWLKLERRGDTVSALYSGDGFGWVPLGSATVPLGSSPRAGLFVSSLNPSRLAQGRFDQVRLLPCFTTDIGRPGRGGSLAIAGSAYTLTSNGNNALHPGNNTSDAQFYAYRDWSGDGSFTVRLDSLANSNTGRTHPAGEIASAGIALRESAAAGARQVSVLANFANQLEFLARTSTGGGLAAVSGSGSPLASLGVNSSPRWLRLSRAGNTISAAHSPDGSSWMSLGSVSLALPNSIQIGLFADSQVRFETATAAFSNVSFFTPVTPSFSGSDIGNAGSASSSISGSTYTLKAAGSGHAGTADAFRLHSSAFTGDGTLVARLAYFADESAPATPLAADAQLGLTLRANSTIDSPHTTVTFTPQLGLRTLSRSHAAGPTSEVATYGAGEVSIQRLGSNYRPLLHYFTGNDFMKSLHDAFPAGFSSNFAGFTTDSPYSGYQKWGGSENHPDALRHRAKIILYERWLQQRGREHQFIANSADGTDFDGFNTGTQSGRDAWDLLYKQQSLRSIQLHQLEGGRPDKVLFESWYAGPFTLVPETQTGTFTNLVADGIKYLKGTGQNLDLLLRASDEPSFSGGLIYQDSPSGAQDREWQPPKHVATKSFVIRLINRGEVDAYPVLHAHETGSSAWNVAYSISGSDVTAALRSATGLPVTDSTTAGSELIAPGASVDLTVTVAAQMPAASREVLVRAFWNPQDSSARVRDSVKLSLLPPSDPLLAGITGDWPFDENFNDFSGLGRHLTATGGALISSSPVKQGSGALNLNAASSYLSSQSSVDLGDAFTLSAWIHLPAGTASIRTIAANSAGGATTSGFRFFVNGFNTSDGKLILETGNGSQGTQIASPVGTVATDTWQHVAAVINRSSGTATLYCNGLAVASGSVRTNFSNDATLAVGAMTNGGFVVRGTIDDLRLHTRTLSASEVGALLAKSNLPPNMIPPGDQSLAAGSTSAALSVLVSDPDNSPQPLLLTAVSSNPALLPAENIVLGGSGADRTVTVTPVAWGAGLVTVTLAASDGVATTEASFQVTVTNGGFSALWTGTGTLAPLPWSGFSNWAASQPPFPGIDCALDFLSGMELPAGSHVSQQDRADPFTAYRLTLGGSGAAGTVFSIQGSPLSLVANGTGTPAIVLAASGAFEHRVEVPLQLGTNVQISGSGAAGFDFRSPLSGSAGLVKSGTSRLVLSASNTYTGSTNIQGGIVRASHAGALGTTSGGTTVQGGTALASLELVGGISSAEPLQLVMHNTPGHVQLRSVSGENMLTGQLSLNSGGGRWDLSCESESLILAGPVLNIASGTDTWRTLYLHGPAGGSFTNGMSDSASGNSKLNVEVSSGCWHFSNTPKSYTGTTVVSGGSLRVDSALASAVTVQSGGTFSGSGSTSKDLILQTGATIAVRPGSWNSPPAAFAAARVVGTGASAWTVQVDATGLTNFSETPLSILFLTASGGMTDIEEESIAVDASGFPGSGSWSVFKNAGSLSLVYTPDLYVVWTVGIEWNGSDSSPGADPDGDGLSNLLEYALGSNPLRGGGGTPTVAWDEGGLQLSFQRIADPALLYEVIGTSDLLAPVETWQPVWSSTGPANSTGSVTVDDVLPGPFPAMRFLRLRVTR